MAHFGAKCQKLFEDKDTATFSDVQYFPIKSSKQSRLIIKLLNLNTVKKEQSTHTSINMNKFGGDWFSCTLFLSIEWMTTPHILAENWYILTKSALWVLSSYIAPHKERTQILSMPFVMSLI